MDEPQFGDSLKVYVPAAGRGWDPSAPLRTMNANQISGPFYRDGQGMRIHYGRLTRTAAVRRFPGSNPLSGEIDKNGLPGELAVGLNGQTPMVIINHDRGNRVVVVTSREIFIWTPESAYGWTNLTPIYNTGTVSATNGSAAVVGTGTLWKDVYISASQMIQIPTPGGNWYMIDSVTDNTHLTLASNFTGTTGGGKAYTIRRTFCPNRSLHVEFPIFAEIFNGDLFVAGTTLGGLDYNWADPVTGAYDPITAVIKVPEIFDRGVTNATSTYIFSRRHLLTPTTPEASGSNVSIKGMAILDDGRVVIACDDLTGGPNFAPLYSRLRFSSHLDHTKWISSPGGYLDIVSTPDGMNAMGRWGRSLTCHFTNSLLLANMTGQDSQPLWIQPQPAAEVGAIGARAIKMTSIGEVYLGSDFNLRVFDGTRSRVVGSPAREILADIPMQFIQRARYVSPSPPAFMTIDAFHQDADLWVPDQLDPDTASGRRTLRYTFHYGPDGEFFGVPTEYPGHISAVGDVLRQDFEIPNGWTPATGRQVVGYPTYDPDVAGAQTALDPLFALTEDSTTDQFPDYTGDNTRPKFGVWTEDLDFGLPGIDKTLHRLWIWGYGLATVTESIEVEVTNDGGVTVYGPFLGSVDWVVDKEILITYVFEDSTIRARPGEKWRIRIGNNLRTSLSYQLTRFIVEALVASPSDTSDDAVSITVPL